MRKIEKLLLERRYFEAWFLARFSYPAKAVDNFSLDKANFDPSEPRDARGWWTDGDGAADGGATVTEVVYRGHFHDLVVDDLLKGLEERGSQVLKNVSVLGLNGVVAIPDGAAKPEGWSLGYFIEVKTGGDPPFTDNQKRVYPLICLGGHATSYDPRIKDLGLTPGVPFPPMQIMLVYTTGPAQPLYFIDYCEKIGFGGRVHVP